MCHFGELDGTGFFEQSIQLFFLTAGCVVNYTGLFLAILIIALLPLYIYGGFVYWGRIKLSTWKGKIYGFSALLLSLILIGVFWLSAAIMGTWG